MESPNPFSREAFLAPAPPPKPAKLSRRLSRKGLAAGLAGAVIVGVGSFVPYLIREHRRNPYATMQNGLILRAVHVSKNQTLRQTSLKTNVPDFSFVQIELPRDARPFSAVGRASTGDIVLLRAQARRALPANILDLLLGDRYETTIALPRYGVAATFEWLDVSLEDDKKRKGTWRVYGLPPLERVPLLSTPLREQKLNGIQVEARAWWSSGPSLYSDRLNVDIPIQAEIKAVAPASSLSRRSDIWSVQIQSVDLEWEPPASSAAPPSFFPDRTYGKKVGRGCGPLTGPGTSFATVEKHDYSCCPTAQRLARVQGRLVRYAVTMETVTFRNLPLVPFGKGRKVEFSSPPFLETPRGVRVQLGSPGSYPGNRSNATHEVAVVYSVSIKTSSPQPARGFQIQSAVPSDGNTCRAIENNYFLKDDSTQTDYLYPGRNVVGENCAHLTDVKSPPSSLPALTIQIAHQTEVQSTPISLVVPIQKSQPTDVWSAN